MGSSVDMLMNNGLTSKLRNRLFAFCVLFFMVFNRCSFLSCNMTILQLKNKCLGKYSNRFFNGKSMNQLQVLIDILFVFCWEVVTFYAL